MAEEKRVLEEQLAAELMHANGNDVDESADVNLSLNGVADGIYVVQALQENGQVLQSKLMIEK